MTYDIAIFRINVNVNNFTGDSVLSLQSVCLILLYIPSRQQDISNQHSFMQIEEKQITIHALQKIINNEIHVHLSI